MSGISTTPPTAAPKMVEDRLQSLENKFRVAIAVATIFGVSGAFGATQLIGAQKELTDLKNGISTVQSARDNAISDIKTTSARQLDANKAEMDIYLNSQATTAMRQELEPIKVHLRYVYAKAVESPQSGNGANGWWQKSLEANNALAQQQLK